MENRGITSAYSIEEIGAQFDNTTRSLVRLLRHKQIEAPVLLQDVVYSAVFQLLAAQATVLMPHRLCQVRASSGEGVQLRDVALRTRNDQGF